MTARETAPRELPTSLYGDVFATFAKEGGRIGSGSVGSGQGGVGRCAGR
ncbi:hypothetical protein [Streptomyces sp. NPDC018045]